MWPFKRKDTKLPEQQAQSALQHHSQMELAARLAGFFSAHAIWCVSDGSVLIPILAVDMPDGTRAMHRLAAPTFEESAAIGRRWIERNEKGADRAVLIYDGFITLPTGKVDALLVTIRVYGGTPQSMSMAIPYRAAKDGQKFAVHRPKFLGSDGGEPDYQLIGSAFFESVARHDKAAPVWNEHLDESL